MFRFVLDYSPSLYQPSVMGPSKRSRPQQLTPLLLSLLGLSLISPAHSQTPPAPSPPPNQPNTILSPIGAQRLVREAEAAISGENHALAQQRLKEARQVYNQLSNFYQELSRSFSGIESTIADRQRDLAVETAQKRDEATYQLALVHRATNEPDLAVPLLVQVIRSQSPTADMGQKSYQQLFELGFVDVPYPRNTETDLETPQELRPLNQPNSLLSRIGAQRLISQAEAAVNSNNYPLAQQRFQEARQVYNQLSNFYQELANSFSGIDNRISNRHRDLAVETAEKRDQATYELALVHRGKNEGDLAVPLLIQVLSSQNPTTEMGKKAYQQLLELEFVDLPNSPHRESEPTSFMP